MSTLKISNVQTTNATTDLSLTVGNTVVGPGVGPAIILYSNNSGIAIINASASVILSINSSSNVVYNGSSVGGAASATVANVSGTGQLITSGNVTPSIITSNTTSWNPDPTSIATVIRVQANAAGTASNTLIYEAYISGLVAGTNGEIYTISNIGAQKIQLQNESNNEPTAANRFSLPNHFWLYGYQSIQMIYDGTLARWKPLTCVGASPALSFGYDYDNTITLRTDHKVSLIKGFMAGGGTPGGIKVTTADKITYSTDTVGAVTGANLAQGRDQAATAGNAEKGFFAGGIASSTTDRIAYVSETRVSVSGANVTQLRNASGGSGNADKGFFAGGSTPAISAITDRTTYSSETTAAVSGANLTQARGNGIAGVGNVDKGFYCGGYTTTGVTTSDRTTYSTETTAAVSGSNLSQARWNPRGVGNVDKGFISAGVQGIPAPGFTYYTTTERITYSSETLAAVSGANLGTAREGPGNCGNKDNGYFGGGQTSSAGAVISSVEKIAYSNETRQATFANTISQARGQFFGV